MNEQPEALRLADALDDLMWEEILIGGVHIGRASYELRRLHAENERLREEVKAEREACAKVAENGLIGHTIAIAIRERGET